MTKEEIERLAKMEVRLEVVQERLDEFKTETNERLEELKTLVMRIPPSDPPPPPPTVWTFLASNWKPIMILLGLITGGTSLIEALKLLP